MTFQKQHKNNLLNTLACSSLTNQIPTMTSLINNFLYKNPNITEDEIIQDLSKYTLTNPLYFKIKMQIPFPKSFLRQTPILEEPEKSRTFIEEKTPLLQTPIKTWYTPKHENTLYWCIFMLAYGEQEYLAIGSKYKNAEIDEKMRIIDGLQKEKKSLKTACFKLTNNDVEQLLSSLMVNIRDDYLVLIGYVVYYKLNIVVLPDDTQTYLVFSPQQLVTLEYHEDQPIYQMKCKSNGKYQYFSVDTMPLSKEQLDIIQTTRVRLHHYSEPLRGISNYTMPVLETMAAKLKIDTTNTKLKKQELYDAIKIACTRPTMV